MRSAAECVPDLRISVTSLSLRRTALFLEHSNQHGARQALLSERCALFPYRQLFRNAFSASPNLPALRRALPRTPKQTLYWTPRAGKPLRDENGLLCPGFGFGQLPFSRRTLARILRPQRYTGALCPARAVGCERLAKHDFGLVQRCWRNSVTPKRVCARSSSQVGPAPDKRACIRSASRTVLSLSATRSCTYRTEERH